MRILIMNGVVIALVLLILLLVVGAVIYFSTQEEEEEKDIEDEYIPVDVITETPVVDETEVDTFDIVNGWLYDTTYSKMIGIGADGKLKISAYNSDAPEQRSKWTFEPTGSSFYILDQSGKALKITGSDVQLGNKSGSAKIKIVPHEDGYKLSSNSGRNWIKLSSGTISSVKEESKASIFIIDPSQYYIKSFETDKFKSESINQEDEKDLTQSLSKFDVKCDTGVISGFGLIKDGSKYKYKYDCVHGDATVGTLNDTVLLDETVLTGYYNKETDGGGLAGENKDGFKVNCDTAGGGGALASFRLLQGDDKKAHYEYVCRDINVMSDQEGDNKPETKNTTYVDIGNGSGSGEDTLEAMSGLSQLNCGNGRVLTGFEYNRNEEGDFGVSGICKKLAA